MTLMQEYLKYTNDELEEELRKLIQMYNEYNKERDVYLFIYASAIGKQNPDIAMTMDDYYTIYDILRDVDKTNLDFYIETPGGSGEAAEEIAEFIRDSFDNISFVISGEAKSAGTILTLSGDEIYMTKSGSLGPIDARLKLGRSVISAYDYIEWVEEKSKEAEDNNYLSPFDATMIAQIDPGELKGVLNALKFAEDLVKKWLAKYKFRKWNVTETTKTQVTEDMKKERAEKIAQELTRHNKWRSHGRSIKINDLEEIGLKINRIDDDSTLAEIVYRIQTVIRMLFSVTDAYKIFATQDEKLVKNATKIVPKNNPGAADVAEIDVQCNACGKSYKFYVKFLDNPKIDEDFKKKGIDPLPKSDKMTCDCGSEIDLNEMRNNIENSVGKKVV